MGKIYVLSTPQTYPFACPQAKQTGSLSERGLKNSRDSHDLKLRIIISSILQSTSKKSQSQKHIIQYPSLATKFI